jgi:hypothetical protein
MADGVRIELFVFPDGIQEETIVFGDAAREQRLAAGGGLVVACRHCGSDLVFPVDWERTASGTWLVSLSCAECHCQDDVALDRMVLERFIAQLHRQRRLLQRDAERWSQACFKEEAERFVAALWRGDVQPFDF